MKVDLDTDECLRQWFCFAICPMLFFIFDTVYDIRGVDCHQVQCLCLGIDL